MHPLLYEINTRCWLRELSNKEGRPINLANVPAQEFARWQELGFTHIWLMGVWPTGPRSRALALHDRGLRETLAKILPDWSDEDVPGSPYAIADYTVSASLGGDAALQTFREQLHARGLKLILDFVPNHLGLDHPWITERPELFVQSRKKLPGTFRPNPKQRIWLAHGKDPYFPSWVDTVQLDYRRAETQQAMTALLQAIATRCDGVRCDMAMLLLKDIFAKTWDDVPCPDQTAETEFWADAIGAVRRTHPHFLFLAEAYWDLEPRLQSLGFDFTYHKKSLDLLLHHRPEVQRHLLQAGELFLQRSAHFLENHDEPRIASRLNLEEHRAAALLMLSLPGMRFLHEGQLEGARLHVPVQLGRRPVEQVQDDIAALYQKLLAILRSTAIGQGQCHLPEPRAAWPDNPSAQNFVIVLWQSDGPPFDLVVVNLAPHPSQCRVQLPLCTYKKWRLTNLLGNEEYLRDGAEMSGIGLYLDLPANGAQLFHCEPADTAT